jgi:hypothetical protein
MDVRWARGGWSASGAVRYVPSYDDVDALGSGNGRKVAAQTLVDAQIALDLGEILAGRSPWQGFEVRLGALNLLNTEPPFAEVGWLSGYDLSQGDLRQRFAYLKLSKKF